MEGRIQVLSGLSCPALGVVPMVTPAVSTAMLQLASEPATLSGMEQRSQ
jgi:hypothetical protein